MDETGYDSALAGGFQSFSPEQIDLPLAAILEFCEQSISDNPKGLRPLSSQRISELKLLTEGIEFDLDEPLGPEHSTQPK